MKRHGVNRGARLSTWVGWGAASVVGAPFLLLLSGCGAQSQGDNGSTETGNPPLLASEKLSVAEAVKKVVVEGEPGAVTPGGTKVTVTRQGTDTSVTVTSKDDGSFSATLTGGLDDEYIVQVGGGADAASVSVTATAAVSELGAEAACQRICEGPTACGAAETLFPVYGCDCDDGDCECTVQECVEQCVTDMTEYQMQGAKCAAMTEDLWECMTSVPCEVFAQRDREALADYPSCVKVVDGFEDVCDWVGGGVDTCGGAQGSSGGGLGSNGQLEQCDMYTTCLGAEYGLNCALDEEERYECTCTVDGDPGRTFESASGCQWPDDDGRSVTQYLNFRCGWELPFPAVSGGTCEISSFFEGREGSPGACSAALSCGSTDVELDCVPSSTGVECSCSFDGEVFARQLLDADGCSGAQAFAGESVNDVDVAAVFNAICGTAYEVSMP